MANSSPPRIGQKHPQIGRVRTTLPNGEHSQLGSLLHPLCIRSKHGRRSGTSGETSGSTGTMCGGCRSHTIRLSRAARNWYERAWRFRQSPPDENGGPCTLPGLWVSVQFTPSSRSRRKRCRCGLSLSEGGVGAHDQLVVNNLEQLLRTDRIYTIKWRAGGPLRCRSRSHRSGGSTIRRYVRLASRYSIWRGRRIGAILVRRWCPRTVEPAEVVEQSMALS